mmetsp:Transcript_74751/g.214104  ORF Transcript_74751/g.214104 Transcript_74751/m.214104 type:complete len:263 (+) Transcript_74751:177-965(+)
MEQLALRVPVDLLAGAVIPDTALQLVAEHVYPDATEPGTDVEGLYILWARQPNVHPGRVIEIKDDCAVPSEDERVAQLFEGLPVLFQETANHNGMVRDEVRVDICIPREQLRLAAAIYVQHTRRDWHDDVATRIQGQPPLAHRPEHVAQGAPSAPIHHDTVILSKLRSCPGGRQEAPRLWRATGQETCVLDVEGLRQVRRQHGIRSIVFLQRSSLKERVSSQSLLLRKQVQLYNNLGDIKRGTIRVVHAPRQCCKVLALLPR